MALTIVRLPSATQLASYLTQASASTIYATKASPTLTGTIALPDAGITDLGTTIGNLNSGVSGLYSANFLTQSSASSTYLTQSSASAEYSTKVYADSIGVSSSAAAVNYLTASAPAALNTLDELSAALGDDSNFATTITNLIAEKIANVPGMLSPYAGSSAPTGWLLCDGSTKSTTTNPELTPLYNVIGTTYGGTGATDFKLPDLRGRTVSGKDNMGGTTAGRLTSTSISGVGAATGLGNTGGTETTTHNHTNTHNHWTRVSNDGSNGYISTSGLSPRSRVITAARLIMTSGFSIATGATREDSTDDESITTNSPTVITKSPTIILNYIIKI